MIVAAGWWRNPINSDYFKNTLYGCSNDDLLFAYDQVWELNVKENGWKTKRKMMIEEMGRRGMSFSI